MYVGSHPPYLLEAILGIEELVDLWNDRIESGDTSVKSIVSYKEAGRDYEVIATLASAMTKSIHDTNKQIIRNFN